MLKRALRCHFHGKLSKVVDWSQISPSDHKTDHAKILLNVKIFWRTANIPGFKQYEFLIYFYVWGFGYHIIFLWVFFSVFSAHDLQCFWRFGSVGDQGLPFHLLQQPLLYLYFTVNTKWNTGANTMYQNSMNSKYIKKYLPIFEDIGMIPFLWVFF